MISLGREAYHPRWTISALGLEHCSNSRGLSTLMVINHEVEY